MVDKDHLNLLKKGVKVWNDWRKNNPEVIPDLIGAKLRARNLSNVDFSRTKLKDADLSKSKLKNAELDEANLIEANLNQADLRFAGLKDSNLRNANLRGAKLNGASLLRTNFQLANLSKAIFVEAHIIETNFHLANLSYANLEKANLVGVVPGQKLFGFWTNIGDANFVGANLKLANLSGQNVNGQNFREADLSQANLTRVEALGTNFTNAVLTGACIEDWHINNQTNLSNIVCNYIYLKENKQERRPHELDKIFGLGEFVSLFKKALETVDLVFNNGVNWQAFIYSFKQLQIKCDDQNLDIEAIEKKSESVIVVRIKVAPNTNKAEIEKFFRQEYEIKVEALEEKYRSKLNAKDKDITYFRQLNTSLIEIIKSQANQANNITQIEGNNMAGDRNIEISGGTVNASGAGAFSLGDISGTVANTINQMSSSSDPNQPDIKKLLIQLKEAIEAEPGLDAVDKNDALEEVNNIAKASQEENKNVKQTKIGKSLRMLQRIAKGLPATAALVTICKELIPTISSFFDL